MLTIYTPTRAGNWLIVNVTHHGLRSCEHSFYRRTLDGSDSFPARILDKPEEHGNGIGPGHGDPSHESGHVRNGRDLLHGDQNLAGGRVLPELTDHQAVLDHVEQCLLIEVPVSAQVVDIEGNTLVSKMFEEPEYLELLGDQVHMCLIHVGGSLHEVTYQVAGRFIAYSQ